MKYKFYCPDLSDKRITYARDYLIENDYEYCNNDLKSDFILLGVNPQKSNLEYNVPIFAGNICGNNIYDYTKDENFAIENAFLTAESAISLACLNSERAIINSKALIIGYGRIGKALQHLLYNYTKEITICARNKNQLKLAELNNSKAIDFSGLINLLDFDFIFNTVPHPVLNEKELANVNKKALIIDLASFPGGVDKHFSASKGLNLIIARGLPGIYSPMNAGQIVGRTVDSMIKEGII